MASYDKRRYKIEHGKLVKLWDGEQEGWYISKADAWAAIEPKEVEPEAPKPVEVLTVEDKPKLKRRGRPRKK